VAVDTSFVGTLRGFGKVYLQSVLDRHSRHAWGRLYTSKMPVTAVHVLNRRATLLRSAQRPDRDDPLRQREGVALHCVHRTTLREVGPAPQRALPPTGRVERRTTKVRRPQSNGFIERFHRTFLDEHLRTKGRATWYETVGEMQEDLETYLERYNRKRPHRDRGMKGRTPYEAFTKTLPRTPDEEVVPKAA
jgi:transposase InsO family protein